MEDKKCVLLLMYRKVLAEFVVCQLRETTDFRVTVEYDYQNIQMAVDIVQPELLLFEIPESGEVTLEKCIENCKNIKNKNHNLKILLLVSEKENDIDKLVVNIIKDNIVDDFLFYDTSMRYLMTKVRTMV